MRRTIAAVAAVVVLTIGGFWGVHQFSVDSEGSLYTADVHVGRAQKFRPRAGADPNRLVGAATRQFTTDSSN